MMSGASYRASDPPSDQAAVAHVQFFPQEDGASHYPGYPSCACRNA
jgi:hypothetical protein